MNLNINPKVAAGGLAGSVVVVLLWALKEYGGVTVPPEIAAEITVIASTFSAYKKAA